MGLIETEALKIIDRLIDCQQMAAINNTELAEYYLSELEWQIVENYLRIPGQKPTKPKPGFIGALCGTPIVIQESVMKQPTKEQLNDPKWWNQNALPTHTHYCLNNDAFFDINGSVYKRWGKSIDSIPRPDPAPWRGMQDGLPPVGTECEYTFKAHTDADYCEWDRCTIQYRSDYGIVIKEVWSSEAFFSHEHYDLQFRPILSERILAERDEGIVKMLDHIEQDYEAQPSVSTEDFVTDAVRQLYDGGWRKHVTLEEAFLVLMMRTSSTKEEAARALAEIGYEV